MESHCIDYQQQHKRKYQNRCQLRDLNSRRSVTTEYSEISSKNKKEHEYKDNGSCKDNGNDIDTDKVTETLTVCYIFKILMTQTFQV